MTNQPAWKRVFAAKGRGEFPRDMLRYDECTFFTPLDEKTAGIGYVSEVRTVLLTLAPDANGAYKPTCARWKSFGWDVDILDARTVGAVPETSDLNALEVAGLQRHMRGAASALYAALCEFVEERSTHKLTDGERLQKARDAIALAEGRAS